MLVETDLSPAEVLMRLYNNSMCPGGMARLAHKPGHKLTLKEAEDLVAFQTLDTGQGLEAYFDYLAGRIIKTDVMERPLRSNLYDRDNGQGAMERALNG
jgi:hypothetical protein